MTIAFWSLWIAVFVGVVPEVAAQMAVRPGWADGASSSLDGGVAGAGLADFDGGLAGTGVALAGAGSALAGVGGQAEPSARADRGHVGLEGRVGLGGGGFDLAVPLARHFGVRVGGDFIRYTGTFEEDGATIDALVQTGYGKAEFDYFPRGGRFHISPLLIFANSTRLRANVVVDPSQQIELSGEQFRSSAADPLHGFGRVDLRRNAPGLSVGFGNLTRGRGHFVFPVELGFFYVAQPKLTVNFSGTACDVSQPPEVGCIKVQDNADFQKDLKAFIARNNHNLSYAQILPILNFGVGYRF